MFFSSNMYFRPYIICVFLYFDRKEPKPEYYFQLVKFTLKKQITSIQLILPVNYFPRSKFLYLTF